MRRSLILTQHSEISPERALRHALSDLASAVIFLKGFLSVSISGVNFLRFLCPFGFAQDRLGAMRRRSDKLGLALWSIDLIAGQVRRKALLHGAKDAKFGDC